MAKLTLKANASKTFFDRPEVIAAIGRAKVSALSKAGAYVRRTAQLSLSRTGKGPSKPGRPPRKVTGRLRDSVAFAYDKGTDSVVVGPIALNQVALAVTANGLRKTSGNVPALHEFGGRQGIIETYLGGSVGWVRRDLRRTKKPDERTRVRVATYPARPYMSPALVKNAPKFPKLFVNSIK